MNVPAISVILPAYNCEKYIGKAIQSVLDQTFKDFELIIINDGSTDQTEKEILSFKDPRIVYLKNPGNEGLIFTLNRAIDTAQGKYIARMDSDDICLPERLKKQKEFLDDHDDIAVVSCTVDFINEQGEKTGIWELDRISTRPGQIRRHMRVENCMAHPTVMMRSPIIKDLKYKSYQENIEDYDLWLRILNRGYKIQKLREPLLLYRIHGESVTKTQLKKANPYFLHWKMKKRFVFNEMIAGRISYFLFLVSANVLSDLIKGIAKAIKNLFR